MTHRSQTQKEMPDHVEEALFLFGVKEHPTE